MAIRAGFLVRHPRSVRGALRAAGLAVALLSAGMSGAQAQFVMPNPQGQQPAATPGQPARPPADLGGPALAMLGPASVADVAGSLLDAVVNISTSTAVSASRGMPSPELPNDSPFREFFDQFFNRNGQGPGQGERPMQQQTSLGSGFVIDPSGIIVTNNHVIDGADEIVANFNDGTRLIAELVGRDVKTDVAVLRVNPVRPLHSVNFGSSTDLRVGDWVLAIGNPFGLGGSVSVGILSARNRDINAGPYDDFLQTDAAINRGNSGGPLFNMKGEVVGINTAIISPTGGSIGIGFALPSELATHIVGQLREFGQTRRGWIGVRVQQVTDEIADGLGMELPRGALIQDVTGGGPAARAGIVPGDVVLTFDGRAVRVMRDLPRMVADSEVGRAADLVVLRHGEETTIAVEIELLDEGAVAVAAAPEAPRAPVISAEGLGLTLAELTPDRRRDFSIAERVRGVLVTNVARGSLAAEKQVIAGDVILEVGQEAVDNPAGVDARIAELQKDNRRTALLLVSDRSGVLRFVPVRING